MTRRKTEKEKLINLYKREQQTRFILCPPEVHSLTGLVIRGVCILCPGYTTTLKLGECPYQWRPQKGLPRLSSFSSRPLLWLRSHLSFVPGPQRTQRNSYWNPEDVLPLSELHWKGLLPCNGQDYLPVRFYLPSPTETSLALSFPCMYVFVQSIYLFTRCNQPPNHLSPFSAHHTSRFPALAPQVLRHMHTTTMTVESPL